MTVSVNEKSKSFKIDLNRYRKSPPVDRFVSKSQVTRSDLNRDL